MKKYTSVFGLFITNIFWKMMGVFAVMILVQGYLFMTTTTMAFSFGPKQFFTSDKYGIGDEQICRTLPWIFENSLLGIVFIFGFTLLTILLATNCLEKKEKVSYTFGRLLIPEKQIFLIQGLCHSLIYMLFFTLEIIFLFCMGQYYFSVAPDNLYSHQTLFLTFYCNPFLHNLLPMEDILGFLRNLILILCFGFETAFLPYRQRHNGNEIVPLCFLTITIICIILEQSDHIFSILMGTLYLSNLIRMGILLKRKEEKQQ